MNLSTGKAWGLLAVLVVAALGTTLPAADTSQEQLDSRFREEIQPFLKTYCLSCHGEEKQEAKLKLSDYQSLAGVAKAPRIWELVRQRLEAGEMPPEDAEKKPAPHVRGAAIEWIGALQEFEAERRAGDPGEVLARRLSNAEYDYTIRDLTGVDIRPTREFPVDPANEAGFDNSGESLAMSPALLKKYLAATRHVADHLILLPEGFVFGPHPMVTETDRDKYCVHRIIDFYKRHQVDYADYFLAAWQFQHRAALGRPQAELAQIANELELSPKYLATIWSVLAEPVPEAGPLRVLRRMWRELPAPAAGDSTSRRAGMPATLRAECQRMRDMILQLRKELAPTVEKLRVRGISDGSQSFVLSKNRQSAALHRRYMGDAILDVERLAEPLKESNPELAKLLDVDKSDDAAVKALTAAIARFCSDFPAAFVVADRGPYFDPKQAGKGRHLTAGFHLMQGYFRDDDPLCDLVLSDEQKRELDELWQELNFITLVPQRQYKDFIFFERAEPPRFMFEAEFDFARSEDKDAGSPEKMKRLEERYIAKAKKIGAGDVAVEAMRVYFANISAEIRWVESARLAAEPSHLAALVKFAGRAYRRPLAQAERDELIAFYRSLREVDRLGHEEAMRDALASVLLSPHFCYRFDLTAVGKTVRPLPDYALASRLSYFLWSSMPDEELLARAAAGDLHEPAVLASQTRRMLKDPRVRGLAVEFGGNWLDIRRFEEHNSVDRERFPSFTNDLRQAMFEEPMRFLLDMLQNNGSVLDCLYADHTFVNPLLAKHYGIPVSGSAQDEWMRIEDAAQHGRGGLLPMAVFLTRNSPGLRTSPVKRGYWVVRRLLGEHIPPPPPTVPELPQDEAKLGELTLPQILARHREDTACAGCHQRFDSFGLAFEGYGPIGERRSLDLGGRPVQTRATFPDSSESDGLAGLLKYLQEKRQAEFVDHLCQKMLSYALGRSLQLSDKKTLQEMRTNLAANGYAIGSLIETIVTSPQFLNQQGEN